METPPPPVQSPAHVAASSIPPKKGLDAGAWLGIGCGGIVVMIVIGFVIVVVSFGGKLKKFAEGALTNPTPAPDSELSRIPVAEKDGKLTIPVPSELRPDATAPKSAKEPAIPAPTPDPAPDTRPPAAIPTQTPAVAETLATDNGVTTATLSVKGGIGTYSFRPAAADGQDAIILRYNPDPNYAKYNRGQEIDLPAMVWTAKGAPTYRRSLIQFNQLSLIPKGVRVVSAQLTLYGLPVDGSPNCKEGNSSGSNFQNNDSYLKMVTQAWNEFTVTWANQPSVDAEGQVSIGLTSSKWSENKTIDIKTIVQSWVNGTPNHGMMLLLQNESPHRSITFGSSENKEAYRPKLVVVCEKGP